MPPEAVKPRPTREHALQQARRLIDRLDARLLLEYVTDCSAASLLAHLDKTLSETQAARFEALVARRARGEPLAYLTGTAGFYGDLLQVSPSVLVPRPETEALVTWALDLLRGCEAPVVVDLGTGSGAIALALAGSRPDARIVAIDLSADAVAVATANRDRLGRTNVEIRCGNWLQDVAAVPMLDLIVSNPPYIDVNDPHLLGDGVAFEPRLALTDGGNGLSAYVAIVAQAMSRLKPGGYLLVEHGHDQADAVAQLWRAAGLLAVESRCDLSGNPRMTAGRKPIAGQTIAGDDHRG